jgi:hypothetical protein
MMMALIAFMVLVSLLTPASKYIAETETIPHSFQDDVSPAQKRMMIVLWSIVACIMISLYFIFR